MDKDELNTKKSVNIPPAVAMWDWIDRRRVQKGRKFMNESRPCPQNQNDVQFCLFSFCWCFIVAYSSNVIRMYKHDTVLCSHTRCLNAFSSVHVESKLQPLQPHWFSGVARRHYGEVTHCLCRPTLLSHVDISALLTGGKLKPWITWEKCS